MVGVEPTLLGITLIYLPLHFVSITISKGMSMMAGIKPAPLGNRPDVHTITPRHHVVRNSLAINKLNTQCWCITAAVGLIIWHRLRLRTLRHCVEDNTFLRGELWCLCACSADVTTCIYIQACVHQANANNKWASHLMRAHSICIIYTWPATIQLQHT